jgi:methylmalonyl-CoA carboxyltransferase 12S subunit
MRFGPAEILLLVITVLGWAIVLVLARRMVRDSAEQVRTLLAKEAQSHDSAEAAAVLASIEQSTGPAMGPVSQPEKLASAKLPELAVKTAVNPSQPVPVTGTDEVSPETLLVIAAAVAAYLGDKVHVRRARLLPTDASAWAQQGRVFIQASHNLQRTRF